MPRRLYLVSKDLKDVEMIEKKIGSKVFQKIESVELMSIESLNEYVSSLNQEKKLVNILLSQRAVIINNKVFVKKSREEFTIFSQDHEEEDENSEF